MAPVIFYLSLSLTALVVVSGSPVSSNPTDSNNAGRNSIAEKWSSQNCTTDQEVYLISPQGQPSGCYPKASKLYEQCVHNLQCQSLENAFCGFHERNDFEEHICACKDGTTPTEDHCACVPALGSCRIAEFNSAQARGGCPRRQFCRYGQCLCAPNYALENGECTWNLPDHPEPKADDLDDEDQEVQQENLHWLEQFLANQKGTQNWAPILALLFVIILGVSCCFAPVALYFYCKSQKAPATLPNYNQVSNDPREARIAHLDTLDEADGLDNQFWLETAHLYQQQHPPQRQVVVSIKTSSKPNNKYSQLYEDE